MFLGHNDLIGMWETVFKNTCSAFLCNKLKLRQQLTFILILLTVLFSVNHIKVSQQLPSFKQDLNVLPQPKYQQVEEPQKDSHDEFLGKIFISIKTTKKFHRNRLELIMKTWFTEAAEQTFIFTDYTDSMYENVTNNHIVNTGCWPRHSRKDLSCKMAYEYNMFMERDSLWWCHFDDDNYVNVHRLVAVLKKFDHNKYVYLGKTSTQAFPTSFKGKHITYAFATGGAGICISRALAVKIAPLSRDNKFVETSNAIQLPDDCTLGFIINYIANVTLTESPYFHSHLEPLSRIKEKTLTQQVTLSYQVNDRDVNIVELDPRTAAFNATLDPTRILSIHCKLFPFARYCPQQSSMS